MPSFRYAARDQQGKTTTGVVEAGSTSLAAKQLREQGLFPTSMQESARSTAAARRAVKGKAGRVRLDDLVIFSRQFATMIRAGLPLIEVLSILGEQCEKTAMRKVIEQVAADVEAGESLNEALAKHSTVFNTFFISMVKAGEAAGMLESILDQVASYLEKVASIQRKVKAAVIYPLVVGVVALFITIFLLAFIVPVFDGIFQDLGGQLPFITQVTVTLSDVVRERWGVLLIIIIASTIALWQWGKTDRGRRQFDAAKLRMPVFGPLFLKVGISKFTRTLGTLIKSGVNILAALEIVAATAGNTVIEEVILKTRTSIQNGETISKPLAESGVFPPMVTRMIDVGERTGALEGMLSKIADFYEDQVDATVSGLTSLIEPILIVFLGLVIGFIVIAMFLPLFSMIQYI